MDQERIIFIIDYLSRFTDKNKYVSIKEIQDHLPTAEQIQQQVVIAEEEYKMLQQKKVEKSQE